MKLAKWFLILLMLLVLNPNHTDASFGLKIEPCYNAEIGEAILCGTYEVMENRQVRKGAKIRLNFVILPAWTSDPAPDPIFCFDGGPGAGAADTVEKWANTLEKFRWEYDIVLLDQRGTGYSNPLPCHPLGNPNLAQTWLTDMYPEDFVKNCRKELEERANLRHYSTFVFVQDLDDLRDALGYDQVNVIGGSYGGYSGYYYMKYYPERVRSAFLWSIAPILYPSQLAQDTELAMERLFMDCASDPNCNADYPDLSQDFQRVLDRLRKSPVHVTITNPFTGYPEAVTFRYTDFITGIRYSLQDNSSLQWTPAFIHWAARGEYETLIQYTVSLLRIYNEFLLDGLFLCVQCTENMPYINWNEAVANTAGTFMGTYRLEQHRQACNLWVQGDLPAGYFDLNPMYIPTLILSGELDPVDPPKYSQRVANSLPNSLHKIIANHAHGVRGVWENCLDDVVLQFIRQRSIEGLDLSCVDKYERPAFISWRDFEEVDQERITSILGMAGQAKRTKQKKKSGNGTN